MRPIKTAESNHNFGPPRGKEDSVGHLPCKVEETKDSRVIYSVWSPSEEERQAIANGQNIRLGVWWIGGMPPMSLGITHLNELIESIDDEVKE